MQVLTLFVPLQLFYVYLSEAQNHEGLWCCWNRYVPCVTIDLEILHVLCAYVIALQDEFINSQALIFAVNLYYAVATFLIVCMR